MGGAREENCLVTNQVGLEGNNRGWVLEQVGGRRGGQEMGKEREGSRIKKRGSRRRKGRMGNILGWGEK